MARRRSKKKRDKSGLGEFKLLIPAALLGLVAFFLKDATGLSYRFVGTYIWLAAYFFAFGMGLSYFAQFILPVDWIQSWFEGLRLTTRYNFPIMAKLLRVLLGRPNLPAATDSAKLKLSPGFITNRAGLLESHQVLALTRGSTFTRAAGPGYVSLKPAETVAQVVDLRRHLRRLNDVKALTRDGIELNTSVTVIFQVSQKKDELNKALPFPYDDKAIFHVNYLNNFSTGDGVMEWSDHVCRQAADFFVAEVANHSLDELYQLDGGDKTLFDTVKYRIQKQLTENYQRQGIDIILVAVSRARLPQSVVDQRISYWESRLERQIKTREAHADADEIRRLSLARARAQIEMIETITDSIQSMRPGDGEELTDIIALRTIEAIEEAASDHAVKALVPDSVIKALKELDRWVESGSNGS